MVYQFVTLIESFIDSAVEEPWLYAGPVVLAFVAMIAVYIAIQRLINDDQWAPKYKALPYGMKRFRFKLESPDSSLILSRNQVVKHHTWQFINQFASLSFPIEVIENSFRVSATGCNVTSDEISFIVIQNQEIKDKIQDIILTEENSDDLQWFHSAPYIIAITNTKNIHDSHIGIIGGLFMGSLRESGIFTQPFYPQKSGKNNHQTILQDILNCKNNITLLIAAGYPIRNYPIPSNPDKPVTLNCLHKIE